MVCDLTEELLQNRSDGVELIGRHPVYAAGFDVREHGFSGVCFVLLIAGTPCDIPGSRRSIGGCRFERGSEGPFTGSLQPFVNVSGGTTDAMLYRTR